MASISDSKVFLCSRRMSKRRIFSWGLAESMYLKNSWGSLSLIRSRLSSKDSCWLMGRSPSSSWCDVVDCYCCWGWGWGSFLGWAVWGLSGCSFFGGFFRVWVFDRFCSYSCSCCYYCSSFFSETCSKSFFFLGSSFWTSFWRREGESQDLNFTSWFKEASLMSLLPSSTKF